MRNSPSARHQPGRPKRGRRSSARRRPRRAGHGPAPDSAAEANVRPDGARSAEGRHRRRQGHVAGRRSDAGAGATRPWPTPNSTRPPTASSEDRILEPGDMASPQKPVFTLALDDPLWVRAYVAETDLGKIRLGMKANRDHRQLSRQTLRRLDWIHFAHRGVHAENRWRPPRCAPSSSIKSASLCKSAGRTAPRHAGGGDHSAPRTQVKLAPRRSPAARSEILSFMEDPGKVGAGGFAPTNSCWKCAGCASNSSPASARFRRCATSASACATAWSPG